MSELKPCPFCGGEAETLTADSMHGGYLFGIMCNDCRSRGDVYDTEAEAIEAWNTRAEYHGYEQAAIEAWQSIKAFKERTCELEPLEAFYVTLNMLDQTEWGVCSNCGTASPIDATYCCECGAKVIGGKDGVD